MRFASRRRFLQQSACFSLLGLNAAPSVLAAGREPSARALRLTIHLLPARAGSSETSPKFLRLMYWNDWYRTIVLPPNPTTIARHWFYPSCEDFSTKRPSVNYLTSNDEQTKRFSRHGSPIPIRPGQSVTYKLKADVFKTAQTDDDVLELTRYRALRIQVRLWPESEDPASSAFSAWRKMGYLWTTDPISLPLGTTTFP
jgi:hypothetical protein